MSEMPDGWSVDVDGEKVVVNFPVEGDYGHRVLSRHQARVLRTQLRRVRRRRHDCAQPAQFAVKQVVGSTKTITVADQLHLSRFLTTYRVIIGVEMQRRLARVWCLFNSVVSLPDFLNAKALVKAGIPDHPTAVCRSRRPEYRGDRP